MALSMNTLLLHHMDRVHQIHFNSIIQRGNQTTKIAKEQNQNQPKEQNQNHLIDFPLPSPSPPPSPQCVPRARRDTPPDVCVRACVRASLCVFARAHVCGCLTGLLCLTLCAHERAYVWFVGACDCVLGWYVLGPYECECVSCLAEA